uniref:Retrovirus-related Pol polyprotein from transposon TNT 1-94 n=1 Tax=Cajanus cajan TaxID=3821 RepID=A0A151TYL6_CAJCA|nr:Retrovirus-related Pol polyprotein from transposon TNT 1-94 [Cajanus cajan]
MQGHKYFLTIVDDFTRFVWVFLMCSKAETQSTLKNFILHVERQFNAKVKMVRSDNGSEFIMQRFYEETGIIHQTSCIETPQQNGIVERKHQHLLNVTISLLFQENLPSIIW